MPTLGILLSLLSASPAKNDSAEAQSAYAKFDFEKCVTHAERGVRARQSASTANRVDRELAELALLGGTCHFNLGHFEESARSFQTAVRADPSIDISPVASPKVRKLFEAVAQKERPAKVEPQPTPQSDRPVDVAITPKPQVGAPIAVRELVAPSRPTPWLAISLTAATVAAAATGTYFGVSTKALESQANAAPFSSDAIRLGDQARSQALITNVVFSIAAAAAVGAVVVWILHLRSAPESNP